ncbi:hypothetical protein N657DRAFT_416638 [Parathielavia appendiculata]|uniref:Uncharacterized protein n=1 Tax=Parathielavia appendiculata TaxID=2587402 RepID=A0AAN6Z3K4_9PEZI|nr:hypothetical protein N657DRAFT_416638 [Parathielavia appendiculata]
METAVEQAAAASRPILVNANLKALHDALDNQAASLTRSELPTGLSRRLRPPVLTVDKTDALHRSRKGIHGHRLRVRRRGRKDPAAVQEVLIFSWLAEFGGTLRSWPRIGRAVCSSTCATLRPRADMAGMDSYTGEHRQASCWYSR